MYLILRQDSISQQALEPGLSQGLEAPEDAEVDCYNAATNVCNRIQNNCKIMLNITLLGGI